MARAKTIFDKLGGAANVRVAVDKVGRGRGDAPPAARGGPACAAVPARARAPPVPAAHRWP
jgi:hypothetical protein